MRGIKRSKRHEPTVRLLAEAIHPTAKRQIFPTMRELVCFAAVLGFEREKKRPLDTEVMEIDARIFDAHQQSLDLLYLIALADTKDVEVLREGQEDGAVSVFEQYAEGGFEILEQWLKEKPEDQNGDQAILTALMKHGFLPQARDVESAGADIAF